MAAPRSLNITTDQPGTLELQIEGGPSGIPGGPAPSAPELDDKPAVLRSMTLKLQSAPLEINDDIQKGRAELKALGMEGHEAQVCLVLDISASMQSPNEFFSKDVKEFSGKISRINQVQILINKALAMGFLIDDNQSIELIPFGGKAYPPIHIDQTNFKEAAQLVFKKVIEIDAKEGARPDFEKDNKEKPATPRSVAMWDALKNKTNYAAATRAVRSLFFSSKGERTIKLPSKKPPVFAIFITDGDANIERQEAFQEFASSTYEAVFWKIIALRGQQLDTEFTMLKQIDDAKKGFVDNADHVILNNPSDLTMKQLFNEYRGWLRAVYNERILVENPGINFDAINDAKEGRSDLAEGCHNEFDHLKEEMMEIFDLYNNSSCCSLFSHHNNRATAVKKAIADCMDLDVLQKIISNQDSVLRGEAKTTVNEKFLSKRWSDARQLSNRKPKAQLNESAFYRAVSSAKEMLENYITQNDEYKKSVQLHKH